MPYRVLSTSGNTEIREYYDSATGKVTFTGQFMTAAGAAIAKATGPAPVRRTEQIAQGLIEQHLSPQAIQTAQAEAVEAAINAERRRQAEAQVIANEAAIAAARAANREAGITGVTASRGTPQTREQKIRNAMGSLSATEEAAIRQKITAAQLFTRVAQRAGKTPSTYTSTAPGVRGTVNLKTGEIYPVKKVIDSTPADTEGQGIAIGSPGSRPTLAIQNPLAPGNIPTIGLGISAPTATTIRQAISTGRQTISQGGNVLSSLLGQLSQFIRPGVQSRISAKRGA